ncbi:hypothetical protein F5883DRAFT_569268 [Diaporthe sp. PMI_573]|nr:hypothetical protein F5883DRAFT_569268 [Diaporthaceae sp. PMI_573]
MHPKMIEFLDMVTTRPMILDHIMDGLSATDSSSLLYALRISDPSPTMLSYLNFIRDFPEEEHTITDYIRHGHKIVFMGEGFKRLSDRIEKPYLKRTGINDDTICIAVLVVPTIASIQYIMESETAAVFNDNLHGTRLKLPIRHLTAVKKPNENGVSIFYKYDCEGIYGHVVKMTSTLVSEQMSGDMRVWNTDSDGMETFKYVYERAPTLMETTVPAMMYELTDVASEERANVGIPYYDFTGCTRGIARGGFFLFNPSWPTRTQLSSISASDSAPPYAILSVLILT